MKTQHKFYFLVILLLFSASRNAWAQDPLFAQVFANRLSLNPALAGSNGIATLSTQYRIQSVSLPPIPIRSQQIGVAYDQAIGSGWNWGLNTQYDIWGTGYSISNHHLHIAKEWQIGSKHFLRAGLSGGVNLRSINYNKLRFPDQIDPNTGMIIPAPSSGYEHFTNADFNAGLVYYNRLFFLSASAKHIQGSAFAEVGQASLLPSFSTTTGFRIPVNLGSLGSVAFSPLAHYQREGVSHTYLFGLAVETTHIQLITWLQSATRFSAGLGTTLGPLQLGYQYNHMLIANNSWRRVPAHELSLGFRLASKEKRQRSAMPMPLF